MATHAAEQTSINKMSEANSVERSRPTRKKRVLVIEDEYSASKFLTLRLKNLGCEVTTAFDGMTGLKEALEKLPDLVILDLMIPKLPGEEVCKGIREHLDEEIAKIPIIMLTGKDSMVDKILGKVLGADAYLTKPYDFADLLEKIRQVIPDF